MPLWVQSAVGMILGLGLSFAMIRWVAPLGWMDRPDQTRKRHGHAIARTGGLALWLGLILLQIEGKVPFHLHPPDWVAIHGMALIGLVDDRFNLRASLKAPMGLAMALLLAWHLTLIIGKATDHVIFLGMDFPTHPVTIFPLLTLWFWAIPQAYNLIDGINGLSLGFAALLLAVLGWNLGTQSVPLWGGLVAVLALNYPKARHFLGDCGALMLGTFFAILCAQAFALRQPSLMLWVFAYPIVDVSLVVGLRKWQDRPLGLGDRSHLHHWMVDRAGQPPWAATPLLLILAGLPMLRATAIPGHGVLSTLGILVLVMVALKAFKDLARTTSNAGQPKVLVHREVPLLTQQEMKGSPSGSHSTF